MVQHPNNYDAAHRIIGAIPLQSRSFIGRQVSPFDWKYLSCDRAKFRYRCSDVQRQLINKTYQVVELYDVVDNHRGDFIGFSKECPTASANDRSNRPCISGNTSTGYVAVNRRKVIQAPYGELPDYVMKRVEIGTYSNYADGNKLICWEISPADASILFADGWLQVLDSGWAQRVEQDLQMMADWLSEVEVPPSQCVISGEIQTVSELPGDPLFLSGSYSDGTAAEEYWRQRNGV